MPPEYMEIGLMGAKLYLSGWAVPLLPGDHSRQPIAVHVLLAVARVLVRCMFIECQSQSGGVLSTRCAAL